MIDERDVLERALRGFEPQPGLTDRVHRRRERKRRNQRIGAGALAIILALVSFVALSSAFRGAGRPADETTPRPTPASPGALAYALDGDIYVAEWDGSNPVRVADGLPSSDCGTGEPDGLSEYFALGPIWSPDGRYLAFRQRNCDGPRDAWWDVVISDREGNVVTSFPSEGWGISWSPDSTLVAVWEHWVDEIGIYGLDGKRQQLLTLPFVIQAGEADPVWSPDGESLLLGLFEIPVDGGTPRQLPWTDDPETAWWTYSPDGSRVAYMTRRSGQGHGYRWPLVIAAADGSNPEQVLGGLVGSFVWSPTGDRAAFVSNPYQPNYRHRLRLLDVETGAVRQVAGWGGSKWISLIGFSPDGDRILLSRTDDQGSGVGSLWTINVDGSDLRRLVAGTAWGDWFSPGPTD